MPHEENRWPGAILPHPSTLLLLWRQCTCLFGTGTEVSLTALRCETLRLLPTSYVHLNDFPNKAGYLPKSDSGAGWWVNEVMYA